jgi:hypothetical protein
VDNEISDVGSCEADIGIDVTKLCDKESVSTQINEVVSAQEKGIECSRRLLQQKDGAVGQQLNNKSMENIDTMPSQIVSTKYSGKKRQNRLNGAIWDSDLHMAMMNTPSVLPPAMIDPNYMFKNQHFSNDDGKGVERTDTVAAALPNENNNNMTEPPTMVHPVLPSPCWLNGQSTGKISPAVADKKVSASATNLKPCDSNDHSTPMSSTCRTGKILPSAEDKKVTSFATNLTPCDSDDHSTLMSSTCRMGKISHAVEDKKVSASATNLKPHDCDDRSTPMSSTCGTSTLGCDQSSSDDDSSTMSSDTFASASVHYAGNMNKRSSERCFFVGRNRNDKTVNVQLVSTGGIGKFVGHVPADDCVVYVHIGQ